MSNKVAYLLAFSLGAAVSSVVTWRILKTKYEKIAQEEIDSVKEMFARRNAENEEDEIELLSDRSSKRENDIKEYADKLQDMGYSNYTKAGDNEEVAETKRPYVISPDEFGEIEEYDTIGLNYYADGVLADEMDEIVEDVDSIVGIDSLTRFGEYEDDTVFVRNDDLKADYEILLDTKTYYPDAVNKDPHPAED